MLSTRIQKRNSEQFYIQNTGVFFYILLDFSLPLLLCLPWFWHFPTFTPLLKEVGTICSLIGRISLFCAVDVTFKCQKQPRLSTLPTDMQPAWDIHLLLAALRSTNKYMPPSSFALPWISLFCSADILRVRAATDKLFSAHRPVYLYPSVWKTDEVKEQPWCYDAPYQTYLLMHIIPRGLSSIFYSCIYPLPSWVVESAVLIVSPFSGRWSEGFRLWRNLI